MNSEQIESIVRSVLSIVLQTSFTAGSAVTRDNTPSWDSLKHMEIFFALEDELGVEFTEAELATLDSVAKIVESVEKKHAS
ncbi:MAG: acyl carrier protein [Gammaproteobacteria bacterium]|nr:acyl carrier protein [Gammaproteobacteria bacterium]